MPWHAIPTNAQRATHHVATCAAHGMLRVARATAPRSERAHAACYTAVHARLGQGGAFMWTVAWFGASRSGMQHAARHVAYNTEEGHTLGTPSRRAAAAFSAAHRNGSRLRESESSDGSRRSAHAPFAQTAVALPRLSCVQCVGGREEGGRVGGCACARGGGCVWREGDTWHTSWIRSHCAGVGSTPVGLCAHACSRMTDPGAAPCAHTRLAHRALVAARSVMLRGRHWSGGANRVPQRTSRSDSIPAKSRPRVAASQ
jgi:hypothetical protein